MEEKSKTEIYEETYEDRKTKIEYKLTYKAIKNVDEKEKKELIDQMHTTYSSPDSDFCGLRPEWVTKSIHNCFAAVSLTASSEDGKNPEMIGLCTIEADGKGLCNGIMSSKCAEISAFCVSKKHPGSGTLLMNRVKSWLKSMGYEVITVSSAKTAIDFYIKRGFNTTGYDYDFDEEDGYGSSGDSYIEKDEQDEQKRFFILKDNQKDPESLMGYAEKVGILVPKTGGKAKNKKKNKQSKKKKKQSKRKGTRK